MSLNSQFIVVLNDMIYFAVQFWDNLLLVLKVHFQVFFLQAKKYKDFPVTGRY